MDAGARAAAVQGMSDCDGVVVMRVLMMIIAISVTIGYDCSVVLS